MFWFFYFIHKVNWIFYIHIVTPVGFPPLPPREKNPTNKLTNQPKQNKQKNPHTTCRKSASRSKNYCVITIAQNDHQLSGQTQWIYTKNQLLYKISSLWTEGTNFLQRCFPVNRESENPLLAVFCYSENQNRDGDNDMATTKEIKAPVIY